MHLEFPHLLRETFLRILLVIFDVITELSDLIGNADYGIEFHRLVSGDLVYVGRLFLLSNDQDLREVSMVLKILVLEMDLSFIDHSNTLMVVVCNLELDDVCVRFTDDRDDEVHEDHEEEEVHDAPDEEGEHRYC